MKPIIWMVNNIYNNRFIAFKMYQMRSLKLAVQPDTRILVTGIPDPADIFFFFLDFLKKVTQLK